MAARRGGGVPATSEGPSVEQPVRWKGEKGIRDEFLKRLSALTLPRFLQRFCKTTGMHHDAGTDNDDAAMAPWVHRLDLARQWFGDEGVLMMLDLVREHRAPTAVRGPLTEHFWGTLLRASLGKPRAVEYVVEHALWMLGGENLDGRPGAHWPGLWIGVVGGLLERGRCAEVQRLHDVFVREASVIGVGEVHSHPRSCEYLPTEAELAAVLGRFVTDPSDMMQRVLMRVYATTRGHRRGKQGDTDKRLGGVYDEVVPLLYEQGRARLAMQWRQLFLENGDLPLPRRSSQATPFLRFLCGMHQEITLASEEREILRLDEPSTADEGNGWAKDDGGDGSSATPASPLLLMGLPRMVYHGGGGVAPGTDDMECARYFATPSFSPVSVAAMLQMRELGPLAMQALARREAGSSAAISHRLAELERAAGVVVGPSPYARFVKRLADARQDALLGELLRCDVHPDEFNHVPGVVQRRLVSDAIARGDLARYRLLMAFQLSRADESAAATLNGVLGHSMEERAVVVQQDALEDGMETHDDPDPHTLHDNDDHATPKIADVLDDMAALGASPSRNGTKPLLLHHYFHFLSPAHAALGPASANAAAVVPEVLHVARRLAAAGWKPAASSWRDLLFRLGRLGRLDDLESVVAYVVDEAFGVPATSPPPGPRAVGKEPALFSGPGLVCVNKRDVPNSHMFTYEGAAQLPLDMLVSAPSLGNPTTAISSPHHPLCLVIDTQLLTAIVRWGFVRSMTKSVEKDSKDGRRETPADWDVGRGVRLVRLLLERCGTGTPLFGNTPRPASGRLLGSSRTRELVLDQVMALLAGYRLGRVPTHPTRPPLTLHSLRETFNGAWSLGPREKPLLPPLHKLETLVHARAEKRVLAERAQGEKKAGEDGLDGRVMDVVAGRASSVAKRAEGKEKQKWRTGRVSYLKKAALAAAAAARAGQA
jgi:hypothetical protein